MLKLRKKIVFKDIRDIINKKLEFTMLYSGVENDTYFKGCYDMGVRNFLMSYQYVRNKNIVSKYADLGIRLFIDSGAFTYMGDEKYQNYSLEQWEKQIVEYLNWAKKNKNMIFAMANLDLDLLVGTEQVLKWNKKYFEPFMLETGIPVCFVYHPNEAGEVISWEKWCQRYPYTGISFAADDPPDLIHDIFLQASKYDTVVHGFGMTKTSILPEIPFYTVDSTSWKAGFRYGQLAIWNGKKVQMFRKEDWQERVIPVIRGYKDLQPPLNEELLYEYNEPEVLRANVYAYQKAEEYIRARHKSIAYWLKAKAVKQSLDNLPSDFFPSAELILSGDKQGLIAFASKMNINPEYEDSAVVVADLTCLLNWDNEKYREVISKTFTSETLEEVHSFYINRIVGSDEERVEDLQNFFKECLSGENDKLLQLGTNFDRTLKERDNYVEDEEEYELQELSDMEVQQRLGNLLDFSNASSDSDERDKELDEEIYNKAGIIPTFDSNGRFIKGQQRVKKLPSLYSKKYPKFACDTCFAAAKCPEFKAGYVCAYNKLFHRFSTRNVDDIINVMQGMVDQNLVRMQRAMVMEVVNGVNDPQVTSFIDQNMRLLQNLMQMRQMGQPAMIHQVQSIRSDGTKETTVRMSGNIATNPQNGSILAKLFEMGEEEPKKVDGEVINIEKENKNENS